MQEWVITFPPLWLAGGIIILLIMVGWFAKGYLKHLENILKEILAKIDLQDLETRANDLALNYIFTENKMVNGVNFIEKKLQYKKELTEINYKKNKRYTIKG